MGVPTGSAPVNRPPWPTGDWAPRKQPGQGGDLEPPAGAAERPTVIVRTLAAPPDPQYAWPDWLERLSPEERQRALRLPTTADRWAYCAAHGLLRTLLSELHGRPAPSWRFRPNEHGRPEIDPSPALVPPIRFSLSHTRGLAACAVSTGALPARFELGIDVERRDRRVDARALAQRFFAPPEIAALAGLDGDAYQVGFLRLWTLKEAVAKATGLGLQLGFSRFACATDPPALSHIAGEWGTSGDWQLHHYEPGRGHLMSLAVWRPPGCPVEIDYRHQAESGWARNSSSL